MYFCILKNGDDLPFVNLSLSDRPRTEGQGRVGAPSESTNLP